MFLYIQDEQYAGQKRYSSQGVALQSRFPPIARKDRRPPELECVTKGRTKNAPTAHCWGEWKPMLVGLRGVKDFLAIKRRVGVQGVAGRQKWVMAWGFYAVYTAQLGFTPGSVALTSEG
ncbi:hypothetical protein [Pseudomonas sp. MWU13-2105]|uniref:hypothetical protein n=1 Tax=Pseudomonas sp. MWU13-2105 TaxID=2935074 RepID=UPI00200FFECF|nr:hypothetical protein [Pseudomonas sp. MWU13-2105]